MKTAGLVDRQHKHKDWRGISAKNGLNTSPDKEFHVAM
jgi:hypothetical protein